MKTSVKNISDTRVEVTITLNEKELATAEKVAITKLAKEMSVKGFRKGKVPFDVALKNADPVKLQDEILNNSISKAVAEVFVKDDIQALERPQVEVKKFVPGEMLEFTAESDILPKVKMGDYKKLKTTIKPEKVNQKDIDEVLERIKKAFTEKKAVKRAAKKADTVNIDFTGKKDGVAFDGGTAEGFDLELGSGSFIPGFEEAIIGHKTGEEFDVDLSFPKDYHAKDLAGEKVVFTVKINSVNEASEPELNDEIAKKAGPFNNLNELKADITEQITKQKEQEASEKQKDDLVQQLVEKSEIPMPGVMIEDQKRAIEQDFIQNLAYQGLTLDSYLEVNKFKDKDEWMVKEVTPVAEKRVKSGLVLAELSKEFKVKVTPEELTNQINMFKMQYQNNPQVTAQFENPAVIQDIENRLATEKTVNRLMEINAKAK